MRALLMIIGIIYACTCGGRTECGNHAQISLLTSIHDDASCRKLSARGVLLYEGAKLLAEIHNNKTAGYDIGKQEKYYFDFRFSRWLYVCDLVFLSSRGNKQGQKKMLSEETKGYKKRNSVKEKKETMSRKHSWYLSEQNRLDVNIYRIIAWLSPVLGNIVSNELFHRFLTFHSLVLLGAIVVIENGDFLLSFAWNVIQSPWTFIR